jgi:hypothetical protein
MNRDQRRHPPKDLPPPEVPLRDLTSHERPPDTLDPRAKSTGHGKKTADKWNQ